MGDFLTTHMTTSTSPRHVGRRALIGGSLAALLTLGSASAWALDTYVIDHVEVTNASAATPASTVQVVQAAAATTVTSTSYTSDTAKITVSKHVTGTGANTVTYYVADVVVSDATILRSAFANDQFGTNIIATTSEIADQADAVLAINGDYYGFRTTGIVIRNGVVFRDSGARQGLAIYQDGTMRLYDETTTTGAQLVKEGVWNTLSFGPGLVTDGQVISGIDEVEIDTNFGNHSVQGQQPRTGIGMVSTNHFVFVVVDGRSSGYSRGVTMTEFADIFTDLGAQVAYNLDGGGSSTMVFNGALVNNPLGKGTERGTSDIIYVAG
jgi:exopolysaccharide biosynthesis protein